MENACSQDCPRAGCVLLISVLVDTGDSYFGISREQPAFVLISHVSMAAYRGCAFTGSSTYGRINNRSNHYARNAQKNVYIANAGGLPLEGLTFTEKTVNTPNLHFKAVIGIFLSVLLFVAGHPDFRSRKATPASWKDLFTKLTWIDSNNIAQVALDSSRERPTQDRGGRCEFGTIAVVESDRWAGWTRSAGAKQRSFDHRPFMFSSGIQRRCPLQNGCAWMPGS